MKIKLKFAKDKKTCVANVKLKTQIISIFTEKMYFKQDKNLVNVLTIVEQTNT